MNPTQEILKAVGRVTGRVRMWRLIGAAVEAGKWCLMAALVLFILDKIVHLRWTGLRWTILSLPLVAFAAWFGVLAARRLRGVNRFEVAKIIDDQKGLKDRLTSALYFDRLKYEGGLAQAAINEAGDVASRLDARSLSVGGWPRQSWLVGVLGALTLIFAVGPLNLASWVTQWKSSADSRRAAKEAEADTTSGAAGTAQQNPLEKIEPKKPITELTRLDSERPPERDPRSMDTSMSQDLLNDIEGIKATVNLKDMKDMQDAFKDDKENPRDQKDTKPPPIAPLDQELLDDIARADKTKSTKEGEGKDDAIGVAVKMPAKPGAKQQGLPKKGQGGHGGGDVGESGDTRGAPRRVPVRGRDRLVIESRRSTDVVQKTDLEKSIMTEVMMRLSMKDVEMTGKALDVPANFGSQKREPVVEETIPVGLRGYVQRYFEGLAPRRTPEEVKARTPTEE